jgi:hypothetical protein
MYRKENRKMLTLFATVNERITSKTRRATTDRVVVDHIAACIGTASTRTRILAFLINASLVLGAIGTNHTLRSTRGWRANVAHLARAHCVIVDCATLAVRAAR